MFELAYKNNGKLIIVRHELHLSARRERGKEEYTWRGAEEGQAVGLTSFMRG